MRIRKIEVTARQGRLRVAAYCRVSTTLTEQEDSLAVQQSTYERYIRSNPAWEFAGLYADARSGLNASKREGFMRMIADAKAGRIDLILCKSISRFSRNIVECQRYVELLRSRNVAVLFEKEYIRTDEPTSNLIFSLMCAVAQDESRSISENIKTANRHRVEAGIYTPRQKQMLGYDVQDGKFVPNEDARIIQHIFTRYAEGAGIREICRELNEQGVNRMRSEKGFSPSAIQMILSNESYVGDKQLQKQAPKDFLTKRPDPSVPYTTNYLTDDHDAIISRKVWEKVQTRLRYEAQARENGARRQGILQLGQESMGTQRFFSSIGSWLDAMNHGAVLVVDELEASMHPLLTRHLIEMIQDQTINRHHAQLIFTTHDTGLLDLKLLRRDQIWFAEKNEKSMQTDVYALTEFSPRKEENIARGYLQGRYGAIPFIGGGF